MPHFVIDCSPPVLSLLTGEVILREVYDAAAGTGLFRPADIKVRIRPYEIFSTGGSKDDFVHVFGSIMQGRSEAQKRELSEQIVRTLTRLLPGVPVISMNVTDFERSTYCNRTML